MKRIWAALLILVLMAALSAASHTAVHSAADDLLDSLEQVRSCARNGDFDSAKQELERAQERFADRGHLLELFLKREYVTNLRVALAGISAYAEPAGVSDLYSEIDKACQQVRMMEHMFASIL